MAESGIICPQYISSRNIIIISGPAQMLPPPCAFLVALIFFLHKSTASPSQRTFTVYLTFYGHLCFNLSYLQTLYPGALRGAVSRGWKNTVALGSLCSPQSSFRGSPASWLRTVLTENLANARLGTSVPCIVSFITTYRRDSWSAEWLGGFRGVPAASRGSRIGPRQPCPDPALNLTTPVRSLPGPQ